MKPWSKVGNIILAIVLIFGVVYVAANNKPKQKAVTEKQAHWFLLHRKTNVEYFYYGIPGNKEKSKVVKKFAVKTGIPGERPTPLLQLVGREYWLLIKKESSANNPETAPYFLTLNVPGDEDITYLYNLLNPQEEEIRYYIKDS